MCHSSTRTDRARVDGIADVNEVLRGRGVLVLHGQPDLAPFYDQTRQQNRDDCACLDDALGPLDPEAREITCDQMPDEA